MTSALTRTVVEIPSVSGAEPRRRPRRSRAARGRCTAARRAHRREHRRPAPVRLRTRIVLGGHLDTVRQRQPGSRLDGTCCTVSGRPTMKGGLAVLLALADDLDRRRPRFDVTLVFYEAKRWPTSSADYAGCSRCRLLWCRRLAIPCSSRPAADRGGMPGHDPCASDVRRGAAAFGSALDGCEASIARHRCSSVWRTFVAATVDVDSLEYREASRSCASKRHRQQRRARPVHGRRQPSLAPRDRWMTPSRDDPFCAEAGADHVDVLTRRWRRPTSCIRSSRRSPAVYELPCGEARLDRRRPLLRLTGSRRATSGPAIPSWRTPRTSASSASVLTRAWRCSKAFLGSPESRTDGYIRRINVTSLP